MLSWQSPSCSFLSHVGPACGKIFGTETATGFRTVINMFEFFIGLLEKFFAEKLLNYLNDYHQCAKAKEVADAPLTNKEEITGFGSWQ